MYEKRAIAPIRGMNAHQAGKLGSPGGHRKLSGGRPALSNLSRGTRPPPTFARGQRCPQHRRPLQLVRGRRGPEEGTLRHGTSPGQPSNPQRGPEERRRAVATHPGQPSKTSCLPGQGPMLIVNPHARLVKDRCKSVVKARLTHGLPSIRG